MAKKEKHADYVHPSLKALPDDPVSSDGKQNTPEDKPSAEAMVASELARPGEMKLTLFFGPATISIALRVP